MNIIIYNKQTQGFTDDITLYINWIEQKGFKASLIEYGNYTKQEYLEKLEDACLLIGFTAAESQGIAWAEAWSADVPTLIWLKEYHYFIHPLFGKRLYKTSTAPYLTESTGAFFKSFDEFQKIFLEWEAGKLRLAPRQWVLENMSDEVSANLLCKIAGICEV